MSPRPLRRKKTGRNEPCPCGSGRKFKRCHGAAARGKSAVSEGFLKRVQLLLERKRAQELQREQQQGWGRPIISAEVNGIRFVAVGKELLWSDQWKTFHDFLREHITGVFGTEWGNAELKKPLNKRHPVCVWYHYICDYQRQFITHPGKVHTAPMTGAAAAWMYLAYDLYSLAHNAEVRDKLVSRLRNPQEFPGVRYEIYVAAALIRAGFDIEFENEDDRRSTHCEFTAKCRKSGRHYSVEAKHRNPDDQIGEASGGFRLGRRLQRALRKAAAHPRIVFIDINVPDAAAGADEPAFLRRALSDIRRFEGRSLNGKPLPSCYLLVTNFPYEHNLEGPAMRESISAEGFQIPDFKFDTTFPSIRAAFEARKAHADLHQLLASIKAHSTIPSTFDGTASELAFGEHPPRLLIGEWYLIPDGEGAEVRGQLTTATVDETSGLVYGAYLLETGESVVVTNKLTAAEYAAYKLHPDTFFGVPIHLSRRVETPLELFDFFHSNYRDTPREKLIELLEHAPDIERLRNESQEELAIVYAERCAYAVCQRGDLDQGDKGKTL